MAETEESVIYLEKDRLFFFDGNKIFKLDFTAQTVRDLDVISEDALVGLVLQFLDSAKPTPSRFIFVLSESVIFANDSTEKDPGVLAAQLQTFADLVPFDQVFSKSYQTTQGVRMIATNAELVNVICEAFEQRDFVRDGIVPATVFGQIGVRRGLDIDTASFILQNQQLARGKSLQEVQAEEPEKNIFKVTKTGKNTMLPYLIGGAALAFVGLLAIIFLRR